MEQKRKKRIIVSVTTDLVADNRVHKTCMTLIEMGFDVLLVGRKLPHSIQLAPRSYKTRRMKLLFNKGFLFYACYNIRLFFFLMFSGFDVLLSNDLDTLFANCLISKLKRSPLVYDSHEYFTEVPELVGRNKVKRFWEWLEQKTVPNLKYAYTVCNSIAKIYYEKYDVDFKVVRNVPLSAGYTVEKDKEPEESEKIILYQGALNIERGLEQSILAMKYLEGAKLIIAGDGDISNELKQLVEKEGLSEKVKFLGRLPIEELVRVTPKAGIGISVEEDMGLSYRYSLPNKLFDYIQAQVPVLVTNLPEMAALVKKYGVGEVTDTLEPEKLAIIFEDMLTNKDSIKKWKENLKKASAELTWENEKKVLYEIFENFL